VLGTVRESSQQRVTVELSRPRPCEGCSGVCLWYRVSPRGELTLAANGALPVGSSVAVTLPERYVLAGAALLYGLPLAALLGGAAAAAFAFGSDLAAAAGAAAALVGALLAAAPLRRRLELTMLRHLAVRPVP
jgi:positive regulator of sigma E activity